MNQAADFGLPRGVGSISRIGVHHAANLRRKAEAGKNGHRLFEHVGFHHALLSNPDGVEGKVDGRYVQPVLTKPYDKAAAATA